MKGLAVSLLGLFVLCLVAVVIVMGASLGLAHGLEYHATDGPGRVHSTSPPAWELGAVVPLEQTIDWFGAPYLESVDDTKHARVGSQNCPTGRVRAGIFRKCVDPFGYPRARHCVDAC